jgi:tripartite-type tricarboxylate transporter receptor subunit TctC
MPRLLLTLVCVLLVADSYAQGFPSKPLRVVVPFAPGGSTDIFARLVAERLAAPLGQSVIVENRAGASGNIGAEAVAKAPADGYTVLMATTGVMAINNALFKSMAYDAAKDFEPVIFIASITNVLAVPVDLPAKNVPELIALAKKEEGKLTFASSGAGSSTHLSAELFKSMAGIDVVHVPFKGSGQALIDVVAGRVSMIFDNMPSALPHIKGNKLRALGVTGSKRSGALPDVPTIAEAGLPGYESLVVERVRSSGGNTEGGGPAAESRDERNSREPGHEAEARRAGRRCSRRSAGSLCRARAQGAREVGPARARAQHRGELT